MKIFQFHKHDHGFWFRIFGVGLSVINRSVMREPFSIRNGLVKVLRVGNYTVRII
jgi:hypothetical protein